MMGFAALYPSYTLDCNFFPIPSLMSLCDRKLLLRLAVCGQEAKMKWVCIVGFVAGTIALSPASAMPVAKPGALDGSQSGVIEIKGGHGHGGGHGWGHRGGRGHHYGWGRGRGHHYGWRHHHRW
jgi:hypothetical protein